MTAKSILQRGLHLAFGQLVRLRTSLPFAARTARRGAHALAFTPDGRLILVTLSYASGWRLPGGGVDRGESDEQAVLRELREEIGMRAHGQVTKLFDFRREAVKLRDAGSGLFIVRDVIFEPRWSLEVIAVRAFAMDDLPPDLAPVTRRLLAVAADDMGGV